MTNRPDAEYCGPPVYGDWMGSLYGMGGHRWEWQLSIFLDGSYAKKETLNRDPTRVAFETGSWSLEDDNSTLRLIPREGNKSQWRIHQVAGLEGARNLLVLRKAILASRNLPILLYRVYPETHHTPLGAYGFPERWPI